MRHAVLEVQSGIWERATVVYGPAEIGVGSPPVRTTNPDWPVNLDDSPLFINPTNMQGGDLARPYFAYTNILYYQKKQISNLLANGKWVATNLLGRDGETTILADMNSYPKWELEYPGYNVRYTTNDLHLTEEQLWINVSRNLFTGEDPGGGAVGEDTVDGSFWTNHTHYGLMSHLDAYRTVDDILYNMVWTYNQGYMDDDMDQVEDDAGLDPDKVGSLYLADGASGCDFDELCALAVGDWVWGDKYNTDFQSSFQCWEPPRRTAPPPQQYNYPHAYRAYNWDKYIMWYEVTYLLSGGSSHPLVCGEHCNEGEGGYSVGSTKYSLYCRLLDSADAVTNFVVAAGRHPFECVSDGGCGGELFAIRSPYTEILGIETNACNFDTRITEWTGEVGEWEHSDTCPNDIQSINWTLSRNSFPVRWDMVNSNDFDGEALEAMAWEVYFGRNTNWCSGFDPPMRGLWGVEEGMGNLVSNEWAHYTNGVMIQGLEYLYRDDWVTDSVPFGEDCGTPGNDNFEVTGWSVGDAILICDYCESPDGFIFCPDTDVDPLPPTGL